MDTVRVSWSGGKDSTAAVLLHLEAGHSVTAVCYVPMFDETTPLITRIHYEFLERAAAKLRVLGAVVQFVHGMTYVDFVTYKITRGKNKGKTMGFPCYLTGKCNFRVYSKAKALSSEELEKYDYEDIGIAADEIARHGQLTERKRSILVENDYSEEDARHICIEYGLLSPLYASGIKRDGCALCPHAKPEVRQMWFNDYPHVVPKLRSLQQIVRIERPEHPPMRKGLYFLED